MNILMCPVLRIVSKWETCVAFFFVIIYFRRVTNRPEEHSEERDERAEQARALRDEGMSYRQIAEELGYKSPSTVLNLLNKE